MCCRISGKNFNNFSAHLQEVSRENLKNALVKECVLVAIFSITSSRGISTISKCS